MAGDVERGGDNPNSQEERWDISGGIYGGSGDAVAIQGIRFGASGEKKRRRRRGEG